MKEDKKLSNIEASFNIEGIDFDSECRSRVKAVLNGEKSVEEAIAVLNEKYRSTKGFYTDDEKLSEIVSSLKMDGLDLEDSDIELLKIIQSGKLSPEEARSIVLEAMESSLEKSEPDLEAAQKKI